MFSLFAEKIQGEEQSASSSIIHNDSAADFTESSSPNAPSDSVNKDSLGDPFSQSCSASTEEAIRLPLGTLVKVEPDNDTEDCVMVGSSEEDSNLLDSSDVSYLMDSYQSSQQTGEYSRSAAYTDPQMSSPVERPQVRH